MIAPGRRSKCSSTRRSISRERDRLGAEAVDEQAHRMGHADRVGNLDLAAVGEPGGDDVLRHVAGGIGGRAVDLRRILAGEGAAAVRRGAAVGVDDDLPPGQPGVPHRPADDELAGRVEVEEVLLRRAAPGRTARGSPRAGSAPRRARAGPASSASRCRSRRDAASRSAPARSRPAAGARARRPRSARSPAPSRPDAGRAAHPPCAPPRAASRACARP